MSRLFVLLTVLTVFGCGTATVSDEDANASRADADFFDECVTGCVADRGLSESECEAACEDTSGGDCSAAAEAEYGDCLDAGGTEDECSDRAGASYDDCTGERNETGTDPCAGVAEQAWQDCIDTGGSDEDCRVAAEDAYGDCAGTDA